MQSFALLPITLLAVAPLTKHHFVGFDGAPAAAGTKALGIGQFDVAAGDAATVTVHGTERLELGGTVAVGDPIKAGADARGIDQGGAGEILAYALSAGDAGDIAEVVLAF